MIGWDRVPIRASFWKPILACHLKGIKDGVHYEYRETMPYKREPEFMEVSPKDYGIKNNTMLQPDLIWTLFFPKRFLKIFMDHKLG